MTWYVLKIHPCGSVNQYFIPFYGQIIFPVWIYIPMPFVSVSSLVDRHLGSFSSLAIRNNAAVVNSRNQPLSAL